MKKIEIYSSAQCHYCNMAKALLTEKGLDFIDIRIDEPAHPERLDEMLARANGQRTVPQIFIDDKHIGGYTDLAELDTNGELDQLTS